MQRSAKGTTLERIRSLAADLFNVSVDQIGTRTSPADIEAWDSLQHLNLALALEQEFQIQLDPEDIERVKCIEDAMNVVEVKLS